MWVYSQSTGRLSHDNTPKGVGYAGTGKGRNNPDMEHVVMVGPIPRGLYTIGPAYKHPTLGPCTMNLDPVEGTDTHGRSAFRMHGDNKENDASHGCIIMGPMIRGMVNESTDKMLQVVR